MFKELVEFITNASAAKTPAVLSHSDSSQKLAVVPANYTLQPLPGHVPPKPEHIAITQRFDTPASLVAYLDRFAALDELLISDVNARSILATLDYHGHHDGADMPDRCLHRAQWKMVFDESFRPWFEVHDKPMTHEAFVAFLDTHGECIVSPTNAELLKLVEQIEIISASSKVSLVGQRGERAALKVMDEQQVQAKDASGTVFQPIREFSIQTAVQQDGKAQTVQVNVNYTTKAGVLGIRLMIHELPKLLRNEFRLSEAVVAASGRRLLAGTI